MFKADLDTVTRTVTRTETETCWSLKDHGGISKQCDSKTAQGQSYLMHIKDSDHVKVKERVPWHRHEA